MSETPVNPQLLSAQRLLQREEKLRRSQREGYQRANALVEARRDLGEGLRRDLASLQAHGRDLDELEHAASDRGSFVGNLLASFSRRRAITGRRSTAEALLRQYEVVSVELRRASAFSDELRLCAAEMQEELDELHRDAGTARAQRSLIATRILEIEGMLEELGVEDARARDQLEFEERRLTLQLQLVEASIELSERHLGPARGLRDTVMRLYEEMARYVLNARSHVDAAGRRIQALGMAADAPMVIEELSASLHDLESAMDATEAYIEQTHTLLNHVLPELAQRIDEGGAQSAVRLESSLEELGRDRARRLAEHALRVAAEEEIASLFDGS